MHTPRKLERDDFDQWISRVLTAGIENARPSEQVWQRIVHHVVNLAETEQVTAQNAGEDKSLDMASWKC